MVRAHVDERGVTLWETLIAVVILMSIWAGVRMSLYGTNRPSQQASAMSKLQSLVDRARELAAINGATLTVSKSTPATVQIYNGFLSGNVVYTESLDTPLALVDDAADYSTFSLAIKRDGSFAPYSGGLPVTSPPLGCTSIAIGVDLNGSVVESQPLDCGDARFRALPPSPAPT